MRVNIFLKARQLRFRGVEIRKLLRPLVKNDGAPAWNMKTQRSNIIFATHDGSPVQSNYREWRFSTFLPNFRGSYFELWKPQNDGLWIMDRAYLSIYEIDRMQRIEREYFALHCDPYEPPNSPHSIYKIGPHLHIQAADYPIPHAHVALNRNDIEKTLSSLKYLSQAIKLAVLMLKEEILDAHL